MTFQVFSEPCDQCLFSANKVVRSNERRSEILRECLSLDTHFICHKSSSNDDICCRGFVSAYGEDATNLMRIARRLGLYEEVNLTEYLEDR